MVAAPALEVKRVKSSEDLLHPGEYVFIEKRAPKITVERTPRIEPLTLEIPLTCPYCKTRGFDIKEGKIITAQSG